MPLVEKLHVRIMNDLSYYVVDEVLVAPFWITSFRIFNYDAMGCKVNPLGTDWVGQSQF